MDFEEFLASAREFITNPNELARFRAGSISDLNFKMPIDAPRALLYRTMAPYEHQRRVKAMYVDTLVKAMLEGTYIPNITPVIFGLLNGKVYQIGGNQRCTALIAADQKKPGLTYVMDIKLARFTSEKHMLDHYTYTHEALVPSQGEKNRLRLPDLLDNMDESDRNLLVSSVREIIADDMDPSMGYMRERANSPHVYDDALHYMPFANDLLGFLYRFQPVDLFGGTHTTREFVRQMRKAPRFGFFVVLFKYQKSRDIAKRMLTEILSGENLEKKTPAWHLAHEFIRDRFTAGGGQGARTKQFKQVALIYDAFARSSTAVVSGFKVEAAKIETIRGVPGRRDRSENAEKLDQRKTETKAMVDRTIEKINTEIVKAWPNADPASLPLQVRSLKRARDRNPENPNRELIQDVFSHWRTPRPIR